MTIYPTAITPNISISPLDSRLVRASTSLTTSANLLDSVSSTLRPTTSQSLTSSGTSTTLTTSSVSATSSTSLCTPQPTQAVVNPSFEQDCDGSGLHYSPWTVPPNTGVNIGKRDYSTAYKTYNFPAYDGSFAVYATFKPPRSKIYTSANKLIASSLAATGRTQAPYRSFWRISRQTTSTTYSTFITWKS